MQDQFSGIESLLGLPQGSTAKISPHEAPAVLTKAVKAKTTQLDKDLKKIDTLKETLSPADMVKGGLSIEMLELDKETIRNEAFEVYRIAKALLEKYKSDVDDRLDINDRMYLAGGKLVDSVVGSLDKLTNMIIRFKQEEEVKGLSVVGPDEGKQKEMSTDAFTNLIDMVNSENNENDNIVDAEIVDKPENDSNEVS